MLMMMIVFRSVQSQAGCVLLLSQHQGAQSVPQRGLPQCGGVQPGTRVQRSGEAFFMSQGLGFGLGLDNMTFKVVAYIGEQSYSYWDGSEGSLYYHDVR